MSATQASRGGAFPSALTVVTGAAAMLGAALGAGLLALGAALDVGAGLGLAAVLGASFGLSGGGAGQASSDVEQATRTTTACMLMARVDHTAGANVIVVRWRSSLAGGGPCACSFLSLC